MPQITLEKPFEYLPVRDVWNLRITCSHIFKVSRDCVFYGRVKISLANMKQFGLELSGRLGKEFALYA